MIPMFRASVKSSFPGKVRSKVRLSARKATKVRVAPSTSPMPECNKDSTPYIALFCFAQMTRDSLTAQLTVKGPGQHKSKVKLELNSATAPPKHTKQY